MEKRVSADVACRRCGARVVVAGTEIEATTRDRVQDKKVPRCRPFEIEYKDVRIERDDGGAEKSREPIHLLVVAKCAACDGLQDCTEESRAYKMEPWPHECGCGCGFTVQAVRKVEVKRYRALRVRPQL